MIPVKSKWKRGGWVSCGKEPQELQWKLEGRMVVQNGVLESKNSWKKVSRHILGQWGHFYPSPSAPMYKQAGFWWALCLQKSSSVTFSFSPCMWTGYWVEGEKGISCLFHRAGHLLLFPHVNQNPRRPQGKSVNLWSPADGLDPNCRSVLTTVRLQVGAFCWDTVQEDQVSAERAGCRTEEHM